MQPGAEAQESPLPAERYNDRELSWLSFNERVLELAENPDLPALDRAKFLAIFASNLDEFFMVRVAGLKRRLATGITVKSASGRPATEILAGVHSRVRDLTERQSLLFAHEILPQLSEAGIEFVLWDDIDEDERARLHTLFTERVYPVLTPLAVDPSHPFPYISGLSLNLAVVVRNPKTGNELFARVKVPPLLDRLIQVSHQRFIPLEEVIAVHLDQLFPGMEILQHHTFRVTRNEDLEVEEDDAENLLKALERELMRPRFGPAVRLEVQSSIDPYVLDLLVTELGVERSEVVSVPGLLDLTALWRLYALDRPDLKQPGFVPQTARELASVETVFGAGCAGGDAPARGVPAPPVRLVQHLRAALPGTGGRRSAGAGDQADPVPDQRRLARSSMPWSTPRKPASRCSRWWRSRPASMNRPISSGAASWSEPVSMSSTAWSA